MHGTFEIQRRGTSIHLNFLYGRSHAKRHTYGYCVIEIERDSPLHVCLESLCADLEIVNTLLQVPEAVDAIGTGGELCHRRRPDRPQRTIGIGDHRTARVRDDAADGRINALSQAPKRHEE